MACGCSGKRTAVRPTVSASGRPAISSTPSGRRGMVDRPVAAVKMRTSWASSSPDGTETESFSTLYECRAWARAHAGWSVDTVRTPV